MNNAISAEKICKLNGHIFPPSICLEIFDFVVALIFCHGFETPKDGEGFIFAAQKIYLDHASRVIDECDVILKAREERNGEFSTEVTVYSLQLDLTLGMSSRKGCSHLLRLDT